MLTANLTELDLGEVWVSKTDPNIRHRGTFPFYAGVGTKSLSVIYADLEPGYAIGEHMDSAEEAILVVEGTLEVTISSESCVLTPGEMIIIPAQTWHNPRNIGADRAQFIGFFAHPEIKSNFKHAIHIENE